MIEHTASGAVVALGSGVNHIDPGVVSGGDPPLLLDYDLLLCVAEMNVPQEFDPGPTGWTELVNYTFDLSCIGIWYMVYRSNDWPGPPSIGVPTFAQRTVLAQVLQFRGVDLSDPFDVVNTPDSSGDTEADIGPITGLTTTPGQAVIAIGTKRDGFSTDIETLSGDLDWEELTDHRSVGLGTFTTAMAIDMAIDEEGGTVVADKTFVVPDGNDERWMGVMLSLNPMFVPDNPQGWPHGLAAPPEVGFQGQGYPRGVFPNYAEPTPPPEGDDRQVAILDTEPIAYWPLREDFAEAAGGAAPDLTPHGSPSFEDGAVRLDGSSQYMLAEDFNPYPGASIITLLVFLARDAVGNYQAILGSYISSYDIYFNSGTSQLVCGDHGTGAQKFLSNTEDFIGSSVQPLFIEISDTGDVVNAWAGTTADGSNGFAIDFTTVAEPDFAIGLDIGISNTGAGSYFPGLVSDVAIWDRALDSGERSAIVAATL